MSNNGLEREHFQLKETIVTIIAEKNDYIKIAKNEIKKSRSEIEQFIKKDKFFEVTLRPYVCSNNDPEIIKKMCDASKKLNVGPMATVAGAIAECALKAMISKGAKHAIVDNGGDIALVSDRSVNIGIYTGNKNTGRFAIQLFPNNEIISICTSSGKIGHSLSFGNADAISIISSNTLIADASATAVGNLVHSREDIKNAVQILNNIKEVSGAIIIIDEKIGFWGEVPQILRADVPYEQITRGWIA